MGLGLIGSFIFSSLTVTLALLFLLNLVEAICIGLFIGFLIFNVNRYLTIGTRRGFIPAVIKLGISLPLSFLVAVPADLLKKMKHKWR